MRNIAVVNGPNLNVLGRREPGIYGSRQPGGYPARTARRSLPDRAELSFFQSNSEGALVDIIQALEGGADGILINAAAYTHTSVAVRDALLAVGCRSWRCTSPTCSHARNSDTFPCWPMWRWGLFPVSARPATSLDSRVCCGNWKVQIRHLEQDSIQEE